MEIELNGGRAEQESYIGLGSDKGKDDLLHMTSKKYVDITKIAPDLSE